MVQTPLTTRPELVKQPCNEAPGDFRLEIVENAAINIGLVGYPSRTAQSWPWDSQIADKKIKVTHSTDKVRFKIFTYFGGVLKPDIFYNNISSYKIAFIKNLTLHQLILCHNQSLRIFALCKRYIYLTDFTWI